MADPRVDKVTVRQLLNQTSGMSDRTFPAFSRQQPRSLREAVAGMRTARLAATPGSMWEYHNPNFQVAARLVEVVAGQPFGSYLQEHIFRPLGMNDSRTIDTADDLPTTARGHIKILGLPLAAPEPRAFGNGSGGVLSSARDMAAWLIMQHERGRAPDGAVVVSPESIATMWSPTDTAGSYGLGWFRGKTPSGMPMISHSGDLFTSTAQQTLLVSTGYGVAVMANTGLAYGDAQADLRPFLQPATPGVVCDSLHYRKSGDALATGCRYAAHSPKRRLQRPMSYARQCHESSSTSLLAFIWNCSV